jgi:hypothetical protein
VADVFTAPERCGGNARIRIPADARLRAAREASSVENTLRATASIRNDEESEP